MTSLSYSQPSVALRLHSTRLLGRALSQITKVVLFLLTLATLAGLTIALRMVLLAAHDPKLQGMFDHVLNRLFA